MIHVVDDSARWSVVKQKRVLQLQCIVNYCIYSFIARIEKAWHPNFLWGWLNPEISIYKAACEKPLYTVQGVSLEDDHLAKSLISKASLGDVAVKSS